MTPTAIMPDLVTDEANMQLWAEVNSLNATGKTLLEHARPELFAAIHEAQSLRRAGLKLPVLSTQYSVLSTK